MKSQVQERAVLKAQKLGYEIVAKDDKIYIVKGFGIVLHWEVAKDGNKLLEKVELGFAGKAKFKVQGDYEQYHPARQSRGGYVPSSGFNSPS